MKRAGKPDQSLKSFSRPLLLLGAGKMGSAMLEGWLKRGLNPGKIIVLEPRPSKAVKELTRRGLKLNPKVKTAPVTAVMIAVKPQSAREAVPSVRAHVGKGTLVLSIMAGRSMRLLESALPAGTAIVRAMPNMPAAIGRGITVAVGNTNVSARQRKQAGDLLSAVGAVEWVGDESIMDAVTAVSGSGPAYVFLLAEAMTKAGIAAGLPAKLAAKLARETVAGSGELLYRSELDPATLRQNVTSPGGTTAAALEVLMGPGGFESLLSQAIAAATKRGRELAD